MEKLNFTVDKNIKKQTITVNEFKNLKGYSVSPKKDFKYEGMIKVKKLTLDNPDLIKAFVNKKCSRNMKKILQILAFITDEDTGEPGSPIMLALNEIEKFRQLLIYKYQPYMTKQEYKKTLKKLEILSEEIKLRLNIILEEKEMDKNHGKGSR